MGPPNFMITQVHTLWQQTSLSRNQRDFSLFAPEVLSFSDDGAVSMEPGLATLRCCWRFDFAPLIPAGEVMGDFHPGWEMVSHISQAILGQLYDWDTIYKFLIEEPGPYTQTGAAQPL